MCKLATLVVVTLSGAAFAQSGPATDSTQRDTRQPTGTVLEPERRLQIQPPPQNPPPYGGPVGGPIQETGNFGNLGLGQQPKPGTAREAPPSLFEPDYRKSENDTPFQRR